MYNQKSITNIQVIDFWYNVYKPTSAVARIFRVCVCVFIYLHFLLGGGGNIPTQNSNEPTNCVNL